MRAGSDSISPASASRQVRRGFRLSWHFRRLSWTSATPSPPSHRSRYTSLEILRATAADLQRALLKRTTACPLNERKQTRLLTFHRARTVRSCFVMAASKMYGTAMDPGGALFIIQLLTSCMSSCHATRMSQLVVAWAESTIVRNSLK